MFASRTHLLTSTVARLAPAAALACGALSVGVAANRPAATPQPTTRPATRPATQQDPADAVLDRLLGDRPATAASQPRDGQRLDGGGMGGATDLSTGHGPDAVAPDTRAQRLVREGTFVIDRVGRARPSRDGRGLEFVFAADGANPAAAGDPPMILVPNLNLMALESALRADPDRRFRVTGRVTEYRGRNHLALEKVVVLR